MNEAELATLAAVAERILPADEHGPGARELGVLRYLQRALAREYAALVPQYRAGLAALAGFETLSEAEQDEALAELDRRGDPFFALVHRHVLEGAFADPAWGGNAGGAGWALLGYPGPRTEWTEPEQRLA